VDEIPTRQSDPASSSCIVREDYQRALHARHIKDLGQSEDQNGP